LSPDAPICVDLDGTLVRSDTLVEGVLVLGPGLGLIAALRRLHGGGRAAFKAFVAAEADLDAALLPYNLRLLDWLRARKLAGHRLILVTAADIRTARAVADHLGIFDDIIASDGVRNNKAAAKAAILVERFGRGGFIYVGDHRSDLPVWQASGGGVTVNARPGIVAAARKLVPLEAEIDDRVPLAGSVLRALRPYQWVKNALVFVPIFTAHTIGQTAEWLGALAMFVAFCAAASGIYLLNDLVDLAADRRHPRKRARPLASGDLPAGLAVALSAILLVIGFGIAALNGVAAIILLYAVVSLAYSFQLKHMPLIDVFALAFLYTIRLFGGGAATGHALSLWLLAFSSFIFLSLALVKRVEELSELGRKAGSTTLRRGYYASDANILQLFGCCASFASCIVLALFVQNESMSDRYAWPALLWGIVPLMLFWQCRLWLSTARGYMHDDPIIYAARDWVSWLVAILAFAILTEAGSGSIVRMLTP
jgi:4-hydroxybenzoate polyprenyltransferase/phosphoserine phosphatase